MILRPARRSTVVNEPRTLFIADARPILRDVSLDEEGFALVRRQSAVRDFFDDEEVRRVYYPEVERVLKQATGADRVHIFDHTVRRRVAGAQDRRAMRRASRCSACMSTTPRRSGPQRVRDLLPDEADELLQRPRADDQPVAADPGTVAGLAARGMRRHDHRARATWCRPISSTRIASARPIR